MHGSGALSAGAFSISERLDKIEVFDGDKSTFNNWKMKVEVHITAGREDVRKGMEWAESQTIPAKPEDEQRAPANGETTNIVISNAFITSYMLDAMS